MNLGSDLFRTTGGAEALPALCRRYHVRRLDVFGSAATGQGYDPARSDLDLLVSFDNLPPAAYAEAYFGLQAALEALAGRKVDLVTEAGLRNPHFRRRVDAERRALFQAP